MCPVFVSAVTERGEGGNRRQLVLSGLGGVRGDLVGYQSLIMAQTEMISQSEMLMPTNPPVQKRDKDKGRSREP